MIPKTFHHIWVGGPVPEHLLAYRETWIEHHPDWEFKLWDQDGLTWLQNQAMFDGAEAITPHVGQFRADLARYEILRLLGGVYVDFDMECLAPIDDLLDAECFAAWETDDEWVNNAVLGSVAGHPLMVDLVDGIAANIEATRGHGVRPNVMTGPQYLTPLALKHDITLYRAALLYPYRWDELERGDEDFPNALAVHHWDNRRKLRGVPRG